MSSPILWGPNNISTNLQGGIRLSDGTLLNQNGTKNYIKYGQFESNTTNGWSLFNTTLTSLIPTGSITAGASSITTFNTTASGALASGYSLQTAIASGTITAGQGFISDNLTLDAEDKAKVLAISFSYSATVGSSLMNFSGTSSNTWAVYVYDNANSAWIQPAGVYNLVQGSGVGKCTATFQTPVNATTIRVAVICINANSSGAVTMLWDSFFVGPQVTSIGPAMSDVQTYTGSLSYNTVTATNITTQTYKKRQSGDKLIVQGFVQFSGAANADGAFRIPLPSGLSIDTTKISSNYQKVGTVTAYFNSNKQYSGHVRLNNAATTYVTIHRWDDSGAADQDWGGSTTPANNVPGGVAIANGDGMSFDFEVPIVGWSTNTIQSADTDTRVVSFGGNQSSQAVTANVTDIAFGVVKDTNGAWNGTQYIVPVAGDYSVTIGAVSTVAGTNFATYKNGSLYAFTASVYASGGGGGGSSLVVSCKAGDTISIRSTQSATITAGTIGIFRLSGPAIVQATESVVEVWENRAGTTITSVGADLPFSTKIKSSHGAFNGTTFTAPVSGTYLVTAHASTNNSTNINEFYLVAKKNTDTFDVGYDKRLTATASRLAARLSSLVPLLAGETCKIVAVVSGANETLVPTLLGENSISIVRVGN